MVEGKMQAYSFLLQACGARHAWRKGRHGEVGRRVGEAESRHKKEPLFVLPLCLSRGRRKRRWQEAQRGREAEKRQVGMKEEKEQGTARMHPPEREWTLIHLILLIFQSRRRRRVSSSLLPCSIQAGRQKVGMVKTAEAQRK